MSGKGTRRRSGQHPCKGETLAKRYAHHDLSSTAYIMAANPVAVRASGLAAEAAGAGVRGTVDPLDEMISIFTMLGIKINQRDGMISVHNLTGMDDFYYIKVDDAESFVNVWNETSQAVATKVHIPKQHKLKGFLYWYHDQRKRGMIPAADDFDAIAMRLAANQFED